MSDPALAGPRADRFLGGRIAIVQRQGGHRAGLDAALLQATVPGDTAGTAVDLGTGCGTVAFCLAARAPHLRVTGIDSDPAMMELARKGLDLPQNCGFRDRVRLAELSVAAKRQAREAAGLADGAADFVVMNPPYSAAANVRASPDPARRHAHIVDEAAPLAAWVRTAAALLRQGGRLAIVHRADALADILDAVSGRFGGATVLPVHPRAETPAGRVLVGAVRGSRAPLSLLPGLVLHEADGAWTGTAARILDGEAELPMAPVA